VNTGQPGQRSSPAGSWGSGSSVAKRCCARPCCMSCSRSADAGRGAKQSPSWENEQRCPYAMDLGVVASVRASCRPCMTALLRVARESVQPPASRVSGHTRDGGRCRDDVRRQPPRPFRNGGRVSSRENWQHTARNSRRQQRHPHRASKPACPTPTTPRQRPRKQPRADQSGKDGRRRLPHLQAVQCAYSPMSSTAGSAVAARVWRSTRSTRA